MARGTAVLGAVLLVGSPLGAFSGGADSIAEWGFDYHNLRCQDPCPYAHDGVCDIHDGWFSSARCPVGTDWLDCDPCSYREDGECDTPGGGSWLETCDAGTDFLDCKPHLAAQCGWKRRCESFKNEHDCEHQSIRGCEWERGSSFMSRHRSSRHRSRRSSFGHCEYDIDHDHTLMLRHHPGFGMYGGLTYLAAKDPTLFAAGTALCVAPALVAGYIFVQRRRRRRHTGGSEAEHEALATDSVSDREEVEAGDVVAEAAEDTPLAQTHNGDASANGKLTRFSCSV